MPKRSSCRAGPSAPPSERARYPRYSGGNRTKPALRCIAWSRRFSARRSRCLSRHQVRDPGLRCRGELRAEELDELHGVGAVARPARARAISAKPYSPLLVVMPLVPDPPGRATRTAARPAAACTETGGTNEPDEPSRAEDMRSSATAGASSSRCSSTATALAQPNDVWEPQPLGRADRPLCAAVDSLLAPEARGGKHAGLGEIAADG